MANSLEVRCPLLDQHLVEYTASLPSHLKLNGTRTKLIFKEAIRGLLPDQITARKKMGFAVPVGSWLRTDLQDLVSEYVLSTAKRHDLFDASVVKDWHREHQTGLRDRTTELWILLVFNMWYDRFLRETRMDGGPALNKPPSPRAPGDFALSSGRA
jgi:asparagine synthase (glutamine-hydrolysing)